MTQTDDLSSAQSFIAEHLDDRFRELILDVHAVLEDEIGAVDARNLLNVSIAHEHPESEILVVVSWMTRGTDMNIPIPLSEITGTPYGKQLILDIRRTDDLIDWNLLLCEVIIEAHHDKCATEMAWLFERIHLTHQSNPSYYNTNYVHCSALTN